MRLAIRPNQKNRRTVSVGFVGDSISVGHGDQVNGVDGFRPGVATELASRVTSVAIAPCDFYFVGASESVLALLPTRYAQGYGGTTTRDHIDGKFGAPSPVGTVYGSTVSQICPQVIRLCLGVNDNADGIGGAYVANLGELLADLHTQCPGAVISVGQLIAQQQPNAAGIVTMNGQLPGIVATALAAGIPCVLEANPNLIFPTDYDADTVHPNALGYAKHVQPVSDGIVAAMRLGHLIP